MRDDKVTEAFVKSEPEQTKGIFKGKQRTELQEQAEQLKPQIASTKQSISSIVQGYGHTNVKERENKRQSHYNRNDRGGR